MWTIHIQNGNDYQNLKYPKVIISFQVIIIRKKNFALNWNLYHHVFWLECVTGIASQRILQPPQSSYIRTYLGNVTKLHNQRNVLSRYKRKLFELIRNNIYKMFYSFLSSWMYTFVIVKIKCMANILPFPYYIVYTMI